MASPRPPWTANRRPTDLLVWGFLISSPGLSSLAAAEWSEAAAERSVAAAERSVAAAERSVAAAERSVAAAALSSWTGTTRFRMTPV